MEKDVEGFDCGMPKEIIKMDLSTGRRKVYKKSSVTLLFLCLKFEQ